MIIRYFETGKKGDVYQIIKIGRTSTPWNVYVYDYSYRVYHIYKGSFKSLKSACEYIHTSL